MDRIEWGKVVDDELLYAPPEIIEDDGRVKELKTYDDFINAGYKRIIKRKPPYNPYLQYLVLDRILEKEDIYVYYDVKDNTSNDEMALTYEQMSTIIEEEVENNG